MSWQPLQNPKLQGSKLLKKENPSANDSHNRLKFYYSIKFYWAPLLPCTMWAITFYLSKTHPCFWWREQAQICELCGVKCLTSSTSLFAFWNIILFLSVWMTSWWNYGVSLSFCVQSQFLFGLCLVFLKAKP
jgi:hypothetical protein